MKTMRYAFAFFILALFVHVTNQVNVQEFNTDAPKYYPFGVYDRIDSASFKAAAYGSFQFSIATWFKIAPSTVRTISSTEYDALLHLTALDTDFPWDYTTCPSSMTQLADLILVRLNGANSQLYVNIGSFASAATSDQTNYGLVTDCWHFLYVGVDHLSGAAAYGVFSEGCQGYSRWNGAITFGTPPYTNEALDDRLTLYLGGAKNHIDSMATGFNSWPGSLYRTMFLGNFVTLSQPTARMLMNGEAKDLYFFYLDATSVSAVMQSYSDPNTYASLGLTPSNTASYPNPTGVTGFKFVNADSDAMYLTLYKEIGNYHFVSFWVKIDDSTPTSTNHLIMSVVTPGGSEFISVVFVKASTSLTIRRGSASVPNPQTITLGAWNFVYLSFGYHTIDTSASIVAQLVVNNVQALTNQVLIATIPEDFVEPLRIIHFGSLGGSDSVINGEIRNIIGGSGSYFTLDTSSTTCVFSVGLQDPYCLYCPTGMYYDTTGTCVTSCPSNTYLDHIANSCLPCHETCATCSGPGPAVCTSCAIDTPVSFDDRCFATCPLNTIRAYDGSCDCDSSCSGCSYNENSKVAECLGCALPTYSLLADLTRCVNVGQCPTGYVSDLSTQTCVTSCSGVIDYANGKCSTYCPTNTRKVAGPPVECHANCPKGTFQSVNTPSVAGETTRGCTVCTAPCASCLSALACLTCNPPYLYHEDVNQCYLTCQAGFEYEAENNFCRACRTGCTACSPLLNLYPADSTCVEECPIGTEASSGVCMAVTGVDAKILNNSGLVPPLTVSIRENLVLLGDYVAPSTIETIEWSLSDPTLSDEFFLGVNKAAKDLVIPRANLLDGQAYTVIYTVTDSLANIGSDRIHITTESAITAGNFDVSPSTGTAFETEFTFTISGFSSSAVIEYDITTFFERTQIVNGQELIERIQMMAIARGVPGVSYTFTYPLSRDTIPFTVELCAYTSDQEVCVSKKVTVKNSGELPLQKVIVWTSDASTKKEIGEMLDFVRSVAYFYTRDWTNKISTNYYRGLSLIKNLALEKELVTCSKVAECSNSGSCSVSVSGGSFTCACESDQGGYNCFYGERDFDTVTIRVRDILKNLFNIALTESNVETAILILDQLSNTMDLLERNSIFFFRDIVANILKVEGLEYHHYRYLFSILGETIEFVKRPLTSTWFKATDQSLLLSNLTSLVETTFNRVNTIRTTENYFIADTNFIEVFMISDSPTTLLNNGSYYRTNFETFGYRIPKSVLLPLNRVSIKMLGYKVNPYQQSQTNSQVTSVSKLEIHDVEGEVSVTGSADKIIIYVPKLTATPEFIAKSSSKKAWNCQFKTATDGPTINFDTAGCSFVEENTTHIACACNHLTEFTGQLVLENVALIPSAAEMLDATTDLIATQILYETKKRVYIIETPETPTVIVAESPIIIRDFIWNHNGFYIGIVVFAIFIFAYLLNMGKVQKNSLKKFLEEGQPILVLTYHPILSVLIRAHTPESNTQVMRISKFFCQLESYIGLTGLVYFLLDLIISLTGGQKLVATAVITLLIAPLASYLPEVGYQRHKKKKNEDQRMSKKYQRIQLFFMVFWFLIGVASIGFIQAGNRGSWLGSLILTAALDLLVLDFLVLIFAMVKRNNSKLLKCFQRKGYYVDVGSAAVMKNDDEAILMAKIRKVLRKSKNKIEAGVNPANDTSRALTFGDKSNMESNPNYNLDEIDDVNGSIDTDSNNPFSPAVQNTKEDEVALNSKRSQKQIKTQEGQNRKTLIAENQPQVDKQQVAETRGNREAEEQPSTRPGNRKRTSKPTSNEDEQLVDSKLDLSDLAREIDKHPRGKVRDSTSSTPQNSTSIKRPSVPTYEMYKGKRNSNRTKTKF